MFMADHQLMTDPGFMLRSCGASCGVCSTVCEDHHEDCKGWAKDKQCDVNKDFMIHTCPASCGICQELEWNVHKENARAALPEKDET